MRKINNQLPYLLSANKIATFGWFFNAKNIMSDEKTELVLAKLPSVPAELESAFINDEFIDGLIKNIRMVLKEMGDGKS